jgi:hypothetical protein
MMIVVAGEVRVRMRVVVMIVLGVRVRAVRVLVCRVTRRLA